MPSPLAPLVGTVALPREPVHKGGVTPTGSPSDMPWRWWKTTQLGPVWMLNRPRSGMRHLGTRPLQHQARPFPSLALFTEQTKPVRDAAVAPRGRHRDTGICDRDNVHPLTKSVPSDVADTGSTWTRLSLRSALALHRDFPHGSAPYAR